MIQTAVFRRATPGPKESIIACFVSILMHPIKMSSSLQTPHGEKKMFLGLRAKAFLKGEERGRTALSLSCH